MSLGRKLQENRIKNHELSWSRSLKGVALELRDWLVNAKAEIIEDIENGSSVERLYFPAHLDYRKNFLQGADLDYMRVIGNFMEDMEREQIIVSFTELDKNDIMRYGDDEYQITLHPYVPPMPKK